MTPLLTSKAKRWLARIGLYHRLKASFAYRAYWWFADKRVIQRRTQELEFYRNALKGLRPGDLIFDIGANEGFKTDLFLALGARVVAVDPDASNQEILRQKYQTFQIKKRPVRIVGKALSDHVGIETFWVNQPGSALNTLNAKWVEALKANENRFGKRLAFSDKRQVETTTLDELIRDFGIPYFIKIDVEGYEATVMKGLKSPVPFLSFELNLPEFLPEALDCIAMLEKLDPLAEWSIADCAAAACFAPWISKGTLIKQITHCNHPSIEIYWKSSAGFELVRNQPFR